MYSQKQLIKAFSSSSRVYASEGKIQKEVANHLLEFASPYIKQSDAILDLGSGTGNIFQALSGSHYCVAVDISYLSLLESPLLPFGGKLCASAQQLSIKDACFPCVISSFLLQWCHPVRPVIEEVSRILSPGGYFIFSVLLDRSFDVLRNSWNAIDKAIHVHDFQTMESLHEDLSNYFLIEENSRELRVDYYACATALVRQLHRLGITNRHWLRSKGLMGKSKWYRFLAELEHYAEPSKGIPLHYDVLFVVARKR